MKKILILFLVLLFPTIVCAKAVTKEDLVEAANYYNNICDSEEKKYVAKEDGTCTVPQTIEVTDDKVIITDNFRQNFLPENFRTERKFGVNTVHKICLSDVVKTDGCKFL